MNMPLPRNALDMRIGKYILSTEGNDYSGILKNDTELSTAEFLGGAVNGLLSWFPMVPDADVLVYGSLLGAFADNIAARCGRLTIYDSDEYRLFCTGHRLSSYKNIEYVSSKKFLSGTFDVIIFAAENNTVSFITKDEYISFLEYAKAMLAPKGRLIGIFPNRLGTRYLCGASEAQSEPFSGIADDESDNYRFDRNELTAVLKGTGFSCVKLYYPYPDFMTPQLIYTDEYPPQQDISERLKVYVDDLFSRFISEKKLSSLLARNNTLNVFSNQFIAECSNDSCCEVIYSAISGERAPERSFATVICSDDTVRKIPVYAAGIKGLEKLMDNTSDLKKAGIPVLDIELRDNKAVMKRIRSSTLSNHIRDIVKKGQKAEFTALTDRMYENILKSSEHSDINDFSRLSPESNWGPVLKKAYIEMIPVNAFFDGSDIMYYDQEYDMQNCPAGYVMFRVLHDIYMFIPEAADVVPLYEMQKKYGLADLWDKYLIMESEFCGRLGNADIYKGRPKWLGDDETIYQRNRKAIKMRNEKINRIFDPVWDIKGKEIILFGSGRYADHYIETYGKEYYPHCMIDNNSEKWNTEKNGIPIRSPEYLKTLLPGSFTVIITIADYIPIEQQLKEAGLTESDYRIYNKRMLALLPSCITDTTSEGKYNIGYVTGAFDLFHIGHLNILKNSKSRCHYLIAGVLTDEIIIEEKHKTPFIPFEERMEIVKQCRYVDRVVAVDKHNTDKLNAWKELQFGCFFAGSDHEGNETSLRLQQQLRSLGSDIEFFPYTQSTNSTMLQELIRNDLKK